MRQRDVVDANAVLEPLIDAIQDPRERKLAKHALKTLLNRCEEYEAIQYAAEFLPDGWEVQLRIENHGGGVVLIDPDGKEESMAQGEGVGLDIQCACDQANEESTKAR